MSRAYPKYSFASAGCPAAQYAKAMRCVRLGVGSRSSRSSSSSRNLRKGAATTLPVCPHNAIPKLNASSDLHVADIMPLVTQQRRRRAARSDSEVPVRQLSSRGFPLACRQCAILDQWLQEANCDGDLVARTVQLVGNPDSTTSAHGHHRRRRCCIDSPAGRNQPRCSQDERGSQALRLQDAQCILTRTGRIVPVRSETCSPQIRLRTVPSNINRTAEQRLGPFRLPIVLPQLAERNKHGSVVSMRFLDSPSCRSISLEDTCVASQRRSRASSM